MSLADELNKASKSARILTLDIETAPMLVHSWGLWNQNHSINQIVDPGRVLCFAGKWYDEKKVHFFSEHHNTHEEMIKAAWTMLDECDILVTYNGPSFDVKHLQREFVLAGMSPPSKFENVDLLKVARAQFKFPSNKLDYVAQALGLGSKLAHEGQALWTACLAGDDKAWARMRRYNKQDVILTEALYDRMGAWIKSHPHMGLFTHQARSCFRCGGTALSANGVSVSAGTAFASFTCDACGAQSRASTRKHAVTMRGVR
jgi:DNA polymerase elongation subunit (family B)